MATLLEFVAWVVFCEVPASARSANWFKGAGRLPGGSAGGVREASIRVQASFIDGNSHGLLSMASLSALLPARLMSGMVALLPSISHDAKRSTS